MAGRGKPRAMTTGRKTTGMKPRTAIRLRPVRSARRASHGPRMTLPSPNMAKTMPTSAADQPRLPVAKMAYVVMKAPNPAMAARLERNRATIGRRPCSCPGSVWVEIAIPSSASGIARGGAAPPRRPGAPAAPPRRGQDPVREGAPGPFRDLGEVEPLGDLVDAATESRQGPEGDQRDGCGWGRGGDVC